MTISIGSLFSGIGGFELGLERAIPNSHTIWQVEQNEFCKSILQKHWPHAKIFSDVHVVGSHNLEAPDILCGGFPCQDISTLGKGEGLNGKKSGLWFEMFRIICELRPRVAVLENVPAITFRGLYRIVGSLSEIGYDCEWDIISARQFGAPHLRKRWFAIAYPNNQSKSISPIHDEMERLKKFSSTNKKTYWQNRQIESVFSGMDDGISSRLDKDRLKALGNAIVPQCSEYIGEKILASGLLDYKLECTK